MNESVDAGPGKWRVNLWEDGTYTAEWSLFKDNLWSWNSSTFRKYNHKTVIKYAQKQALSELRKYQRSAFVKVYTQGVVE